MYQLIITRPDGSRETRRFSTLPFSLGRAAPGAPPPDLDLPDPQVSRDQAEIRPALGGVEIRNRGSNMIFVNGQPVYAAAPLRAGDAVAIGPYVLVFMPEEKPAVSPTVALAGGLAPAPAPGRRPRLRTGLVLALGAVIFLALGTWRWQEQRKSAPVLVIKARADSAAGSPAPVLSVCAFPASGAPEDSLQPEIRQGLRLWMDREIDPGYRYQAWRKCLAVARQCSLRSVRLPAADTLLAKIDTLEKEIDSLFQYHRRQGNIASHQGNAAAVRSHLGFILQLIPDREDSRHRWARQNLAPYQGTP